MTKKTLLYVCLGLLCCSIGVYSLNAANVKKSAGKNSMISNTNPNALRYQKPEAGVDKAQADEKSAAAQFAQKEVELQKIADLQTQADINSLIAAESNGNASNGLAQDEEMNPYNAQLLAAKAAYIRWQENGTATAAEKSLIEWYLDLDSPRSEGNPLDLQGGPDGFGYRYVDNQAPDTVVYNWIELCNDATASVGPSGDDNQANVNIGFSFPYYGTNYTTVSLSTNGTLTFGATFSSFSNVCINAASRQSIYAYWDDMLANAGTPGTCANGVIYYKNFGNYTVFEWHVMDPFSGTGLTSVEAILWTSGMIKLQWHATEYTHTSASATVGLESTTGAGNVNGLQYVCNSAAAPNGITAGRAVVFYLPPPPANADLQVSLLAPCGNNQVNPTQSVTCRVTNIGGVASAATNAHYIYDGSTSAGLAVGALAPAAFVDLAFPATIDLSLGAHTLRAYVENVAGDTTRTNDTTSCATLNGVNCADFNITASTTSVVTVSGNTTGAGDDCALRVGIEQIVKVTIPSTDTWSFSLCDDQSWDSYMILSNTCCGTALFTDDDGCNCTTRGLRSLIGCQTLTAGDYYVDIEPFSAATGPWTLSVFKCQTARCCYNNGSVCEDTTYARCETVCGTWTPTMTCVNNPCTEPQGRCCYLNAGTPACLDTTLSRCTSLGGTWSVGLTCAGSPCAPYGRCCYNSGASCTDTLQTRCTTLGGTWHQDSTCANNPCPPPPIGRCCYNQGSACTDTTQLRCTQLSGSWNQALTCATPCPAPCLEFILNAPGNVSGAIAGQNDDCNLRTGNDQSVAVIIPSAGSWTFSLCRADTNWDSFMYLTTACCGGTTLGSDDDACPEAGVGFSLLTCVAIATADTYWVDIEPFSTASAIGTGPWTLTVTPCAPAIARCCYNSGASCTDTTQVRCTELSGTWTSGSTCAANPCPTPPPGDECNNAVTIAVPASGDSTVVGGTTVNASSTCISDCDFTSSGPDVFYTFTLASCTRIAFALTDSTNAGDMHISVYDGLANCCGCQLLCDDDDPGVDVPWDNPAKHRGGLTSYVIGELSAGIYVVRVGRFSTGSSGFILRMYNYGACGCAYACSGGTPECGPEDYCDQAFWDTDTDGGCNNTTPAYCAITCGTTICGRLADYTSSDALSPGAFLRDTDWFTFTLTEDKIVTATVTAGLPVYTFLYDAGQASSCDSVFAGDVIDADSAECGVAVAIGDTLSAGSYGIIVTPKHFLGYPETTPYTLSLVCASLCAPDTVADLTVKFSQTDSSVTLRWTADGTFTGVYDVYATTVNGGVGDFATDYGSPIATNIAPIPGEVSPGIGNTVWVDTNPISTNQKRFYRVVGRCP